jgi:hypothetical protein
MPAHEIGVDLSVGVISATDLVLTTADGAVYISPDEWRRLEAFVREHSCVSCGNFVKGGDRLCERCEGIPTWRLEQRAGASPRW